MSPITFKNCTLGRVEVEFWRSTVGRNWHDGNLGEEAILGNSCLSGTWPVPGMSFVYLISFNYPKNPPRWAFLSPLKK